MFQKYVLTQADGIHPLSYIKGKRYQELKRLVKKKRIKKRENVVKHSPSFSFKGKHKKLKEVDLKYLWQKEIRIKEGKGWHRYNEFYNENSFKKLDYKEYEEIIWEPKSWNYWEIEESLKY